MGRRSTARERETPRGRRPTRLPSPHDRLAKAVFVDPGAAGLLAALARPARRMGGLDPRSLRLAQGTFTGQALGEQLTDLLFLGRDQEGAPVALLVEHHARRWRWLILRLLRDARQILDRARKLRPEGPLPAVLPLVLFPGPGPWACPLSVEELFSPTERRRGAPRRGPALEAAVVELHGRRVEELCALPGGHVPGLAEGRGRGRGAARRGGRLRGARGASRLH